jgi:dethiobiotin synthetase
MMTPRIFIAGTDTDIGKTFISALLVKKWAFDYWKPIQTGLEEDQGDTKTVVDLLNQCGGVPEQSTIFEPALTYMKPLSPWRCTVLENREAIDVQGIAVPSTDQKTLSNGMIIEGAGGLLVPIGKGTFTTDLIKQLDASVILIARSELGTLNHTLMSIEILKQNGIPIHGVVLNGRLNKDNKLALSELGVRILAEVPTVESLDHAIDLVPDFNML